MDTGGKSSWGGASQFSAMIPQGNLAPAIMTCEGKVRFGAIMSLIWTFISSFKTPEKKLQVNFC
jgi:hypothetical protein